jgi:hypothetical protein
METCRHHRRIGRNRARAGRRSRRPRRARDVTRRIGVALKHITAADPPCGRYFSTTIRTGTFCSYLPDPRYRIDWKF